MDNIDVKNKFFEKILLMKNFCFQPSIFQY